LKKEKKHAGSLRLMDQPELFSCSTKEHSPHAELQDIAAQDPAVLEGVLRAKKLTPFAGVDEAGRGPLAGPVVACACVLPKDFSLPGLTDSKQLSEELLETYYAELVRYPGIDFSVAVVDHEVIDRINILQATFQAMRQAIANLKKKPLIAIIDGSLAPLGTVPCLTVVKGDAYCSSVSAASVIAKVTRDRLLKEYDAMWPEYGFSSHKGYGTPSHLEKLRLYGPCPIHRKSFAPVQVLVAPEQLAFPFFKDESQFKVTIDMSRAKKTKKSHS
jgi:ribonuclease HII